MKVNFYLKEPKSKVETLIYLFFSFSNQRLKYSTGELIHPDLWNSETQRVKETKKFPEYPEFNARLDKIETTIRNIYRTQTNDGKIITLNLLRDELDKSLRDILEPKKQSLFEFIEKYIEESKGFKSSGTIKQYNNLFTHLKNYCSVKKKVIDFESIDLNFYNAFLDYLMNDLEQANNTIGTKIKVLKVFLNEATERGLNTNLDFKKRKFKKLSEDNDKIYLSKEELDLIYKHDFSKKLKLERVRDLFIIGCFTGLRFSDFTQIKSENIIEGNKIKIRTQKTGEIVVIPLHQYVKEILTKYEGRIPRPLTNQKMNEYLKDVGKDVELNEMIETSITKGGKLKKDVVKKFDLICTHTARRSFASNLYLADVPAITIMKITGHRTEKSFLRYIRLSQEENANKLLNHPFFN